MTEPNEQSPTPTSEPTPSQSPAPTSEWRAGPHSRLAGRSAEEILGIAEMAIDTLQKFNQPVPQPPVQQQYSRFDMDLGDDELVDGRKVKQILQNFANQPPPIDYGARQLAAQSLLQSIRMERSNEFKRWGPEIFSEINKLPMEYWTV